MNKEDYVSLEVAKMLKEKGFDEPCELEINIDLGTWAYCDYDHIGARNSNLPTNKASYPTIYEVQKWLREAHNIDVLPIIREESFPKKDYCCYIYKNAKVVSCKVAYGEDFYECMNDSLFEALRMI